MRKSIKRNKEIGRQLTKEHVEFHSRVTLANTLLQSKLVDRDSVNGTSTRMRNRIVSAIILFTCEDQKGSAGGIGNHVKTSKRRRIEEKGAYQPIDRRKIIMSKKIITRNKQF